MEKSVFFAPLQGLTDHEFRITFERFFGGVEAYFTPFIRLENGALRHRDKRELSFLQEEQKTIVQVLPKNHEEAVTLVENVYAAGCRKIDINMGCPFAKVVQSGRGAGMLPHPEQVTDVLSITEEFPDVMFSLKMRSGFERSDDLWALIPSINQANLCHVTLHPRTAREKQDGEPDKSVFGRFLSECSHPVLFNGNVQSVDDIQNLQQDFPAISGVMIGRGLLARPDLLHTEWNAAERKKKYVEFYETLYDAYARRLSGETQILTHMQCFWDYFLPDADRKLRKKLKKTLSLYAFEGYAKKILEAYDYGQ
jgi:tRNA-dihydrouridine synthase B